MRTWRPASVTFSNAPTMAQALSGAVGSELPRMDQGPHDKETRVTDREDQLAEQELAEHATGGLAYYKVPSHWRFTDSPLPRNATGKVVRAAVTP